MICAPSVLCMRKGKSRVYDTSEFTDSEQARFVLVRIPKFVFPHFFTFVLFSFHHSCSSSCWNASVMKIAACAHQLPMVGYACIPPFVHLYACMHPSIRPCTACHNRFDFSHRHAGFTGHGGPRG